MNNFDPTKREHINISPLHRFEADMQYVRNHPDMVIAFSKYMSDEFGIPERNYGETDLIENGLLPTYELFEQNHELAREKMRLAALKAALAIAENTVEDERDFIEWTKKAANMAMNLTRSYHDINSCVEFPDGSNKFECIVSDECPVRYVTYTLVVESIKTDFDTPDYDDQWAERKINRTLSKLEAAYDLGIISTSETSALAKAYINKCRAQRVLSPDPTEK